VRTRLLTLLLLLMGLVLAALCIPLAQNRAATRQQAIFVDRLQDTTRFASEAQQVGNALDEQALATDLQRYGGLYSIAVAVLDGRGTVQAGSRRSLDLHQPQVARNLRQALAGHQSEDPATIWPWQRRPLVVAVPVIRGDDVVGAVVTISPSTGLRAGVGRDLTLIGAGAALALVLCVGAAIRLAAWILRPVYMLDTAAREIRTGTLSTRVSAGRGPTELRTLAHSFNAMAHAVEDGMRRQRDFVTDASHQLRNPLAALMLRLEGLGAELDPGSRDEFGAVLDEAAGLRLILDELLELATAQQLHGHPEPVDPAELLAKRVDAWRSMAASRKLSFQLEPDPHPYGLRGYADPALVRSALDAVLDNAIKFSAPGATIRVGTVGEPAGVGIWVNDAGPGLSTQEWERIGDRFWRSPGSQNIPGSGLGLSIARTLLAACDGRLHFAPGSPGGLRVTIWLPAESP
jgi:signal transduction histidine kinase